MIHRRRHQRIEGFETTRQARDLAAHDAVVFLAHQRTRTGDAADFLHHFDHRFAGAVGLHRRHHHETARATRAGHAAGRAVRPVLFQTQIAIEPRGGHAAEVAHHRFQGQIARRSTGRAEVRGDDHRLRRIGFVDQIDLAASGRIRRAQGFRGRRRAAPAAEAALQLGHQRRERDVARDHQGRVRRREPAAVPVEQFGALQRRHRRLRAQTAAGNAVGVLRAVQQLRQQPLHRAAGIRALLFDRGELLFALDIDHLRRKRRISRHVGQQVQRPAEVGAQRAHVHERLVQRIADAERRAQRIALIGQAIGVAAGGALQQQIQRETRGARRGRRIGAEAGVQRQRHAHQRHRMTFQQHHLHAVRQRRVLHLRERHLRRRAQRRQLCAVEIVLAGAQVRERLHDQGRVMAAQPRLCRGLHLRRGERRQIAQPLQIGFGIAVIGLAFGQHVGTPAEAAQPLAAARELGQETGARALQVGGRRSLLHQRGEGRVEFALGLRRIDARLDVDGDDEGAGQLAGVDERADVGRQLRVVDKPAVQRRAFAARQHAGEQFQRMDVALAARRQRPGAVDAVLRHAVLHRIAQIAVQIRHPRLQARQRRARRNRAEILRDQRTRLFHGDVAGQRQHRVVGAVIRGIPLLDVFELRRLQILHAADGRPAVGMRIRIHRLQQPVEGAAVGLVLALALLVLDHAALALQHLLIDVGGEEAHAVGFQIQRALQARDRHVLEEVGAVGIGGAVAVVRAQVVHRLAETVRVVLAAVEEEVLEQMREPGAAAALVARTDVVPDVHRHQRHAVVLVDQHREAVRQHDLLVFDPQLFDIGDHRRGGADGRHAGQQDRQQDGGNGDGRSGSAAHGGRSGGPKGAGREPPGVKVAASYHPPPTRRQGRMSGAGRPPASRRGHGMRPARRHAHPAPLR